MMEWTLEEGMLCAYRCIIFSRYVHLLLDLGQYVGFLKLRVPIPSNLALTPQNDVTVISATLGEEENYTETLRSWLKCNPKAINVVTVERAASRMKKLLKKINDSKISLYTVEKPDIRRQLTTGIQKTDTKLLVLVDDDSQWSPHTLSSLTSAFKDPSVGGANTMQYVRPRSESLTIWESFGALNLVRRNILHSAVAYFNHGQVLNLSGRTVAYRTDILKNDAFVRAFLNDYWRGKHLIRTGDDSFITSWIVHHGWQTAFLNQPDAVIVTTVNDDVTYLNQVLRWSRDTARHYLRDLGFASKTSERRLYIRSFLNWTSNYTTDFLVLGELGFVIIVSIVPRAGTRPNIFSVARLWIEHILISGAFTIFEHAPFFSHSKNLKYLPGAILYMYLHAFVVCFALFTLQKNVWGSRAGVDGNS